MKVFYYRSSFERQIIEIGLIKYYPNYEIIDKGQDEFGFYLVVKLNIEKQ